MNVLEIQKNTKFINDFNGKPIEVILPYQIYQELLEIQMSLEIYQQANVQKSIEQAKKDIGNGNIKSFKNLDEAFEWLDR